MESSNKRCVILAIYSPEGKLYNSTLWLLNEIKEISSFTVVVVNGEMDESGIRMLDQETDVLIHRKNTGFDAGAYKSALNDERIIKITEECDELVFCNDTFWGPFVPFSSLFSQMEKRDCDFWGINKVDTWLHKMIQSYFLVFRQRVLQNHELNSFFSGVDETSTDYAEALFSFEEGIYSFMTKRGYIADSLHKNPNVNLNNMAPSLWIEHLPILKKKAALKERMNFLMALRYVMERTDYPCDMILEEIYSRYGIAVAKEEIADIKVNPVFCDNASMMINRQKLQQFISEHDKIYIFGCGHYGRIISRMLRPDQIAGYVQTVCDRKAFWGKPVFSMETLSDQDVIRIILALGKDNTEKVLSFIPPSWDVLNLWNDHSK